MQSDEVYRGIHQSPEQWSELWFGMKCTELSDRLLQIANDIDLREPEPLKRTRLNRWCLARRTVPCLIGFPEGHPKIADGEPMFSSELYFLDTGRASARSFSRWYELGEQVEPSYWEKLYPRQL